MIYRRFGRTGLSMPVFSCGGMRFMNAWKDQPLKEIPGEQQATLEATVRRALEVGINHIETARGYGTSERQLGQILPGLPREKMIVQTKVCPVEDPKQFRKDVLDSLERLGLEHVELLGIHGINTSELLSWTLKPGGCLAVARELVREGKARHVGFSTHGPLPVILQAIRHEADGGFDYVNLHWFYVMQINWAAIQEATKRDMGVFIISPSDKGGRLYEPPPRLVELCQPLHPMVFNDLFCLAQTQVHTLSIGAARPSDFDRHLEALPLLEKAGQVLGPILRRLEEGLCQAVEPALRDPWGLGLPGWEDTPGNINLPVVLWLRNLAVAYGMVEYGKMRYNLLGSGGHWFPGQNAAKLGQVDLEPVLGRLPVGGRIREALNQAHALLAAAPVKRLQS